MEVINRKIKRLVTATVISLIALFVLPTTTVKAEAATHTVYIGDSRFVGMDNACGISKQKNVKVIAKVGKGYSWMCDTAIPQLQTYAKKHKNVRVVIGLGVNDLYNQKRYIKKYKSLAKKYDLYIVSVTPVSYHKTITNSRIQEFNKALQDVDGAKYINAYELLAFTGYKATDGVHYDSATYKTIYKFITECLKQ